MPMIDYICSDIECSDYAERFFHPSSVPDTIPCVECGQDMKITYAPSIAMRRPRSNALHFDPVVVHRRYNDEKKDYDYSFPSRNNELPDAGYERVEMNSIKEVDRFCRVMGNREKETRQFNITAEKQYWDDRTKERREKADTEMKRRGITSSRAGDMARQYVDQMRQKRYDKMMSKDVNFNNQAFSFDSSNRQEHRDIDTGWKARR